MVCNALTYFPLLLPTHSSPYALPPPHLLPPLSSPLLHPSSSFSLPPLPPLSPSPPPPSTCLYNPFFAAPRVDTIQPTLGKAAGESMEVTGKNFGIDAQLVSATLGGLACTVGVGRGGRVGGGEGVPLLLSSF